VMLTASRPGVGHRRATTISAVARLLVVDDDAVILDLLRVNFELEGHEVTTAPDGAAGLAEARRERPDLVVSDIMMPGMDGLELLAALRADPDLGQVPVVLLSAKAQSAEITAGLEAGATAYVTKPFDPLELVDLVRATLEGARR